MKTQVVSWMALFIQVIIEASYILSYLSSPGGRKACVHVFFLVASPQNARLEVCVKKVGEAEASQCQSRNVQGSSKTSWRYFNTQLDTQGSFEEDDEWAVRIQGLGDHGAKLYVDDVSISPGSCAPLGNCDFEDGAGCGWTQDTQDDFDWLVLQADSPSNLGGPIYDHSNMAFDGETYIMIFTK